MYFRAFPTVVFIALFAAPLLAKPSLQEAVDSLGLPQKLEVQLQGGVASYDEEKMYHVIQLFTAALRAVKEFAPQETTAGFFTPGARFPDRRFRLVLTDKDKVDIDGQKRKADFDSFTAVSLVLNGATPTEEGLNAVLRLDKLVFRPDQSFQTYAFFKLVNSLMMQMGAFWGEHLSIPLPELLKIAQKKPSDLELRVIRRGANQFQALLADPRVLKDKHAGVYLGSFYGGYVERLDRISELTREVEGPFVLPFAINFEDTTTARIAPYYAEEAQSIFYQALHLVHSVRPPNLKNSLLSVDDKSNPVLKNKVFLLSLMDSRDLQGRRRIADLPLAVDLVKDLASETFVLTRQPKPGLFSWLVPSKGFQSFETVLWMDRIFYSSKGANPQALARATVALACEIYGGVQSHLFLPLNETTQVDAVQTMELSLSVFRRGVSFVEALQKDPLWDTVSGEDKKGFTVVREEYVTRAKDLECVLAILKQAKETK